MPGYNYVDVILCIRLTLSTSELEYSVSLMMSRILKAYLCVGLELRAISIADNWWKLEFGVILAGDLEAARFGFNSDIFRCSRALGWTVLNSDIKFKEFEGTFADLEVFLSPSITKVAFFDCSFCWGGGFWGAGLDCCLFFELNVFGLKVMSSMSNMSSSLYSLDSSSSTSSMFPDNWLSWLTGSRW